MRDIIDLGESYKFNWEDEWYKKFGNQVANAVNRATDRDVFKTDWQRFVWAFILGIFVEKRTPLQSKTKNPPFGTEVFKNRNKILKTMIGFTLQEMYKNNPDQLKADFEKASVNNENIGKQIRIAIEEYANIGFSIIDRRGKEKPGYIENIEYIVEDIQSDKTWSW